MTECGIQIEIPNQLQTPKRRHLIETTLRDSLFTYLKNEEQPFAANH